MLAWIQMDQHHDAFCGKYYLRVKVPTQGTPKAAPLEQGVGEVTSKIVRCSRNYKCLNKALDGVSGTKEVSLAKQPRIQCSRISNIAQRGGTVLRIVSLNHLNPCMCQSVLLYIYIRHTYTLQSKLCLCLLPTDSEIVFATGTEVGCQHVEAQDRPKSLAHI